MQTSPREHALLSMAKQLLKGKEHQGSADVEWERAPAPLLQGQDDGGSWLLRVMQCLSTLPSEVHLFQKEVILIRYRHGHL